MIEIIPDNELLMLWGTPGEFINGAHYPELVLTEVHPDFYEENGEPIFGYPEVDEFGDDPRINDGDVMNYLRTVRITEDK